MTTEPSKTNEKSEYVPVEERELQVDTDFPLGDFVFFVTSFVRMLSDEKLSSEEVEQLWNHEVLAAVVCLFLKQSYPGLELTVEEKDALHYLVCQEDDSHFLTVFILLYQAFRILSKRQDQTQFFTFLKNGFRESCRQAIEILRAAERVRIEEKVRVEALRRSAEERSKRVILEAEMVHTTVASPITQSFWQEAWDELIGEGRVIVPALPSLTDARVKFLHEFGFVLMYLPAIHAQEYPVDFEKLSWGCRLSQVTLIERRPLRGQWVAVEQIEKPAWQWGGARYPNDRLLDAVLCPKRNLSWEDVVRLLERIEKKMHFPKNELRLPSAEEWNLIGNLFNWLRDHRSMKLPDLGAKGLNEWCQNLTDLTQPHKYGRICVGSERLSWVTSHAEYDCDEAIGFRVLLPL